MIRIGIAEDHDVVRETTILRLNMFEGMSVVLEACNGRDLLDKLVSNQIDVLLLDIQMPVMDGIEAGLQVRKLYPDIKILMHSSLFDSLKYQEIVKANFHGFIGKAIGSKELESAIRNL